jgi:hypothetical protein
MDHKREKTYSISNRIGFHYFPDSLHYGEKDVELWLPRLKQLNAQWLVLDSPANRAIPEDFISAFSQSRIKTILNFDHPLSEEPIWSDLETLLRSYGKWGVNYALLDQRPNDQRPGARISGNNPTWQAHTRAASCTSPKSPWTAASARLCTAHSRR